MRRILLCIGLGLGCLYLGYAQSIKLQFHLIDKASKQVVTDAHVFVSDSSLGTISNNEGYCELNVSIQETQGLIITHLSYETRILSPEEYLPLINGDTLELQSNGVDFSEITLSAKRGNQWKKRLRLFKKALLGEGKAAASCRILNPEVLRFEEEDGTLWASAIDLLEIENDHLGYDINFWLKELSIEADGSTYFKGNGQFTEQTVDGEARYSKRRDKIYQHSLPHFLRSLLESPTTTALKDRGYEITFEKYNAGEFTPILIPTDPSALVLPDTTAGWYRLYFSEFLTITHSTLKISSEDEVQIAVSNAEQRKYGSSRTQSVRTDVQNAVSRLYKIAPYLLFDERGNIINKSSVREYGYWAEQRLAATLPIDYKASLDLSTNHPAPQIDTLRIFQQLIGYDQQEKEDALAFLQKSWSPSYIAPLLDIQRLSLDTWQLEAIQTLFAKHAPSMKADYYEDIQWLWKNEPSYGGFYANFKAFFYSAIDPAFRQYFQDREQQSNIRLDEIVWGGVKQDGIPPLRSPKMLSANDATYLADTDIVFGLVINGEARAYPKRILAWHEFFTDEIGHRSIAGVYCTLCGTVIIYDAEFNDVKHHLGTSGFLYRSNKLMYDQATQSLWNTFMGKPVVGPLVGQGIELSTLPIETTTWGEWRNRHPKTQVLSLDTGYDRDYAEGEAYKSYFATDNLMFPVPTLDERLPNKARVFIPRPSHYANDPLAISVDYLKRKRIHQDQVGEQSLLILTEKTGASRAYAINHQQFESYKRGQLIDNNGTAWTVTDRALISPKGQQLLRLPAHEAFWFGWRNAFPDTRVVF